MKEGRDEERESWGGGGGGGWGRGRGAQSDEMKGGEMKSLKRDEMKR